MHTKTASFSLESDSKADLKPLETRKYTVRLAETRSELEEVFKLRFNIFNLELGEGLHSSFTSMMDKDEYDAYCDHLIVIDNESQRIVGTYRLQTYQMARSGSGFYTQNEFDLNFLPNYVLSEAFELGRACISKDHRSGRVLYLMWKGIAAYLLTTHKRYLFGCCSLTSQDPLEGWTLFSWLNDQGHVHRHHFAPVQTGFKSDRIDYTDIINSDNIKIPDLFRMYLSIGAKLCSAPALDRQFKTIDYLILLDTHEMTEESRKLFFN